MAGGLRIVLTGGSGQLGSLVLTRLIQSRQVRRIVSLDLQPPIVTSPKLRWNIADVRDPGLERHFEDADALVHLAFFVSQRATAETMRAVNVEASKKLFAHAISHGLGAIVYSSSVAAYGLDGPHAVPITENHPRRSTSWLAYADNKFELEAHLDELEPKHPEVRVARLRPSVLIGRRMPETFGVSLRRGILPKLGSGRIPIVWDEDVADAVVLALLGEARGAFNLSADEPLAAEQMAEAGGLKLVSIPRGAVSGVAKVLRSAADPAWLRAGDIDMVVSSERARRELGWVPTAPTARDVMQRFAAEVPRRTDPRLKTFFKMVDVLGRRFAEGDLSAEAKRVKLELHLNVTGPRGGDFAVNLAEGRARVRPGVPRPPDTVITLSAETLLDLLAGKLDLSAARMTGKVKMQGEPGGGYFLGALVTGFRNATRAGGFRGWSSGKLSSWFEKKAGEGR